MSVDSRDGCDMAAGLGDAHGLKCLPAMELQPAAELLAEIFRARSEDMIQSRTAEESRRRARMASSVLFGE